MDSSSGAGKGSRFESLWESIPRQLSLRTVRRVEDNHRLMSSNSRSHFASQGIAHSNSRYLNYFCQYLETLPRCSALELVDRWIEKHSHFFIQEKYEEEDEEEEDINELAGEEMTDRKTHDLNDVGSGVHNKELAAPHLENGCLSGPKMVWARLRLCCHWESFSATANTVDELFFHVLQVICTYYLQMTG